MEQHPLPQMPTSPTPPKSNALTYLAVALFVVGGFAFFYLLFGELFLVASAVFLAIGTVGGMHYLLWGRAMSEQASKETQTDGK